MNSRFESLNFRGSNGDVQQLPRVRFRLGQNLSLSEGTSRPYLGVYEEAITHQKLPTPFPRCSIFAGLWRRLPEKSGFPVGIQGGSPSFEQRIDSHVVFTDPRSALNTISPGEG